MWTTAEQLVPQQAYPYIESKTSHRGRNHARITNTPHNRSNLSSKQSACRLGLPRLAFNLNSPRASSRGDLFAHTTAKAQG